MNYILTIENTSINEDIFICRSSNIGTLKRFYKEMAHIGAEVSLRVPTGEVISGLTKVLAYLQAVRS